MVSGIGVCPWHRSQAGSVTAQPFPLSLVHFCPGTSFRQEQCLVKHFVDGLVSPFLHWGPWLNTGGGLFRLHVYTVGHLPAFNLYFCTSSLVTSEACQPHITQDRGWDLILPLALCPFNLHLPLCPKHFHTQSMLPFLQLRFFTTLAICYSICSVFIQATAKIPRIQSSHQPKPYPFSHFV